jgi:primosomal protein N' (replication factor Y) (superfamily II helicase)
MSEVAPSDSAIDRVDLGLLDAPVPRRHVEVAVDAAGVAGSRTWTYLVPDELADVAAGEPVLVEWGRRRAVGIVLGDAPAPEGVTARPLGARVRADGPLLPPLALALAREIAAHYLAPPALAIRAMLPPGLLEKLELVATPLDPPAPTSWPGMTSSPGATPLPGATVAGGRDAATADLLEALAGGPRAVRDLAASDGRAALLRRLRALEDEGRVHLEWTLTAAGAGPRHERLARITDAGRSVVGGSRPPDGRPVGPRQRALLGELAGIALDDPGVPAPDLAGRHGQGVATTLSRRGLVALATREMHRDPLADRLRAGRRGARPAGSDLTPSQADALRVVVAAIAAREPTPLLLDGPTGSGRTAVYAEAIAASLEAGRPALILVPEIALALPLVDRLRADLRAEVVIFHSGLGEGERADAWRQIRAGAAEVVVGTRIAVLAPLPDVGLVIVDEEHDAAYKSDRMPRIQARDLAVTLGRLAGAAVILGSATPSVETYGLARRGHYRRCTLTDRAAGAAPAVELVDLRAELAAGNRGLVSERLAALIAALDPGAGDRAILVINRRGAASAVLCRDCGHVQACPECTRPLVYHQAGMTLRCHHCGAAAPMVARCPACGSPRIRFLGGGTERLESEVKARFPGLRVGRLDRDVVERRGAAERLIDAFSEGRLDVLVGTSLVTKGLDVPEVTLVGIVSADIALTLPDERAAERTYQLMVQAIGRAGRGDRRGRAVIQTYQPDHPAIRAVVAGDADAFYTAELALREQFGAPPFGRTVKLTVGAEDRDAARAEGRAMAERLRARAAGMPSPISIAGPAPAYVPRRGGRWRFNLVLRGADPVALLGGDPGPPWSVDVDPESLL